MSDRLLLIALGVLFTTNVLQFIAWQIVLRGTSRQVERLVDKVASRNYAEWVQAENLRKSDDIGHKPVSNALEDQPEEDQVLRELNGMFGLG